MSSISTTVRPPIDKTVPVMSNIRALGSGSLGRKRTKHNDHPSAATMPSICDPATKLT